jgi:hypothetical protein
MYASCRLLCASFFARRCGTAHLDVLFGRSLVAAQRLDDALQLAEGTAI